MALMYRSVTWPSRASWKFSAVYRSTPAARTPAPTWMMNPRIESISLARWLGVSPCNVLPSSHAAPRATSSRYAAATTSATAMLRPTLHPRIHA